MLGLLIVGRLLPANELGTGWLSGLATIVRLRRFWVLVFVSCTVNLSWHFLVNWLPTYLQTDRKMVYLAGGLAAALPFLAADVGNLAGGSLSRSIGRRGIKPHAARLWVMFGGTILIACGAQLGLVPPQPSWHPVALLLLCLMALGAAAFMANYFAFCQEVSPRQTGLVVGYLGGLGNLVAAGFNPVAGHIKDTSGDFSLVFLVAGLAPALGLALLARLWEPSASKDITSPLMENA
jgi:ACS family hexuronate transporter-like MFS transporter